MTNKKILNFLTLVLLLASFILVLKINSNTHQTVYGDNVAKQQETVLTTANSFQFDQIKMGTSSVKYIHIKYSPTELPENGSTRHAGDLFQLSHSPIGQKDILVQFANRTPVLSMSARMDQVAANSFTAVVPEDGTFKITTETTYKVTYQEVWGHPIGSPTGTWMKLNVNAIHAPDSEIAHFDKVS